MTKLHEYQLEMLRPLEMELRKAVAQGEPDTAIEIFAKIKALFPSDLSHHRLLRAKLWVFEVHVDANRLAYAETGLAGVRKRAAPSTRLYLEASALLAVTLLRKKKTVEAKKSSKKSSQILTTSVLIERATSFKNALFCVLRKSASLPS